MTACIVVMLLHAAIEIKSWVSNTNKEEMKMLFSSIITLSISDYNSHWCHLGFLGHILWILPFL